MGYTIVISALCMPFMNCFAGIQITKEIVDGQTYLLEIEIESYGRVSGNETITFQASLYFLVLKIIYHRCRILLFCLADEDRNAFAYNATSSSTTVSWDSLRNFDQNVSEESRVNKTRIEISIQVTLLVEAMFTPEEIARMNEILDVSDLTTSQTIGGLSSGLTHFVKVQGLNMNGREVENSTLQTFTHTGMLYLEKKIFKLKLVL